LNYGFIKKNYSKLRNSSGSKKGSRMKINVKTELGFFKRICQ
jgi:hypothetical protein